MKTIEEQIWDYIDGYGSAQEQLSIKEKIATDPAYTRVYAEMMEIHELMRNDTLDEPSMSFTRNIMEKVALEAPPLALKTKTDQRVIYGLAAIFIFAILFVFGYALGNSRVSFPEFNLSSPEITLKADWLVKPVALHIFLFVDMLLALIFLDQLFRSRKPHN